MVRMTIFDAAVARLQAMAAILEALSGVKIGLFEYGYDC